MAVEARTYARLAASSAIVALVLLFAHLGGAVPAASGATCSLDPPQPGCGVTTGLWSDGETLWVAWNGVGADDGVFAYDIESRERLEELDFKLARRNVAPRGLWSDGETAWVSDSGQDRVFAYDMETRTPLPERDIRLDERNAHARGIWSDGDTMWVLDGGTDSLFSYDLRPGKRSASTRSIRPTTTRTGSGRMGT